MPENLGTHNTRLQLMSAFLFLFCASSIALPAQEERASPPCTSTSLTLQEG